MFAGRAAAGSAYAHMTGQRDQPWQATTAELRLGAVQAARFGVLKCQPLALTGSCLRQAQSIVAQAVQKGDPGPKIAGNLSNVGYLQRSRNLGDVG